MHLMIRILAAIAAPVLLSAVVAAGSMRATGRKVSPEVQMAGAAKAFLASLKSEQAASATFPFNSEERLNWHYIPRARKGLPFKEMTTDQRQTAANLLHTGLSQKGYHKVETIRSLENVLKVI